MDFERDAEKLNANEIFLFLLSVQPNKSLYKYYNSRYMRHDQRNEALFPPGKHSERDRERQAYRHRERARQREREWKLKKNEEILHVQMATK